MSVSERPRSWRWADLFPWTSKRDGYIMVMGMTGSGKTTFISHLVNPESEEKPGVGHSLKSSTTRTTRYLAPELSRDYEVYLIDTPGFDDTTRSDIDILETIASELHTLWAKDQRLLGVIFLHRITDIRLSNSAVKNFTILQKLCGPENYDRIVMATTMWDEARWTPEAEAAALRRQVELEEYWKDPEMFGPDSKHEVKLHLYNTGPSALEVVRGLLDRATDENPGPLQIQRELEGLPLQRTAAGQFLTLGHLKVDQQQQLAKRQALVRKQERRLSRSGTASSGQELTRITSAGRSFQQKKGGFMSLWSLLGFGGGSKDTG